MKIRWGYSRKTGFTLIELLVVVAIIGLLATLSILALNSARSKARDAKRIADVYQISQAMMMYYDVNGKFPTSTVPTCLGFNDAESCWGDSALLGNANFNNALKPYINTVPKDPSNRQRTRGNGYIYIPKNQSVAYHCSATNSSGPLILWYPDSKTGSGFPDSDCLGKGYNACCGSIDCAHGYFCAYDVPF